MKYTGLDYLMNNMNISTQVMECLFYIILFHYNVVHYSMYMYSKLTSLFPYIFHVKPRFKKKDHTEINSFTV
jgi:hypothetical protein